MDTKELSLLNSAKSDELTINYPKTWCFFNEWYMNEAGDITGVNRDMYDFFDSEGVIVEILWYHKSFRANVWAKGFNNKNEVKYAKHFPTRSEAEDWAFLKAFAVREDM